MTEEPQPSPGMGTPFGFLVSARWILLIVGLGLCLVGIEPASRLELDQSIESLYAPSNPYLQDYLESKRTFGGDEFVLVCWTQPNLLMEVEPVEQDFEDDYEAEQTTREDQSGQQFRKYPGLKHVHEVSRQLSKTPGIQSDSTQNLADLLVPPHDKKLGLLRVAYLFPNTQADLLEFAENLLVGEDRLTTAVVLRLKPEEEAEVPRAKTFRLIREWAEQHEYPTYVVGEPVQVHDMFRYVEQDGRILGRASTVILLVVLFIMFRSLRWILLPIAVVQISLVYTKAILVLSGLQLSMVSSMLDSLVTIVGIATMTHFTVHFREFRKSQERREAFVSTASLLAKPILWTILTTAVGFLSLLSSSIVPVQSFGLMMALGTFCVLLTIILIVPGGVLIGSVDTDPRSTWLEEWLLAGLHQVTSLITRIPLVIFAVSSIVTALAAYGMTKLDVETDFSKNFRDSSPIVQSLNFVESNLGGAGNWEVNFEAPRKLDEATIDDVRQMAEDLRDESSKFGQEITKVIALSDGLDPVRIVVEFKANSPTRLFSRMMAKKEEERSKLDQQRELVATMQPEFEPGLYSEEAGRMRIVLRAFERQRSDQKLELIAAVEQRAAREFEDVKATGLYVLLAHLIESLLSDQLVSFAWASAGIVLLMTIAFRNPLIGLISLVPNVFPIVLLIGGLGWMEVPVNIGTAMIACVSLGLTVDSSIHYIAGYRRARREGMSHSEAVNSTHGNVGRALVFANIALICGFVVLTLSHFIPLVYFGVLVSVAMVGGLIGNLVLLPIMLRWVFGTQVELARGG